MINKSSDIFLAVMVVAITAMLLVPLPTFLIDILVVLNLAIAFLLLIAGLYMPSALSLLSFPTIILLTTLFRLALNVASSRLILSQGDAGVVIHSFGTFLIRDQLFVGLVIFSIVTIVNFIVIAKGASRVSEVSARFILDALPGKQASIDSDLRSGLITPQKAQELRFELKKESQLFGAMDGSMKFIQGDAIAGLLIIVTNIIGGLYMGVSQGMDVLEASKLYTVLTVGDGLVSQVPALLISICAGVVVTRVTSAEGVTIGSDIANQLFSNSRTIIFTGFILIVISLFPGVPKIPFIGVGGCILLYGLYLRRNKVEEKFETDKDQFKQLSKQISARALELPIVSDKFEIEILVSKQLISDSYIYEERLTFWWDQVRSNFYQSLGMPLPSLVINKENSHSNLIEILFNSRLIKKSNYKLDSNLILLAPSHGKILGFQIDSVDTHPIWNRTVFWTNTSSFHKKLVSQLGIDSLDSIQSILLNTVGYFIQNPEEIFTTTYIHKLLQNVEKDNPGYISDVIGRHFLPITKVSHVFCGLVKENISVKESYKIFQHISEFCTSNRISLNEDIDVSIQAVVEFVRIKLKKQFLTNSLERPENIIFVQLSEKLTSIFERMSYDEDSNLLLINNEDLKKISNSLNIVLSSIKEKGSYPLILICSDEIRFKVSAFIRQVGQFYTVLSERELIDKNFDNHGLVWTV
jgi:flagellar biosynthesis protein FlhA